MTKTPKCQSWLGHRFEARYSTRPYGDLSLDDVSGPAAAVAFLYDKVIEGNTIREYQGDICVRCGFVVERKTAEKSTEATN